MKKHLPALSLLLGSLVGLTACSGSSGGGGSNFSIVSCNLGCTGSGSGGGGQVSCGIQDVFVNGELRIGFSGDIDPGSLSVFTVQVTDAASSTSPPADRFVDPSDPSVLVYRPTLSFDSSGAPTFGLDDNASYTINLPGQVEDPGAQYVLSTSGTPNRHRMLCTIQATLGVLDVKPGAPSVSVTVDKVTSYDPITGEPDTFALDIPAQGEVDVFRLSDISMVFDDLMNPATLVNPVTGESSTIRILVDPDGIVSDSSDQQELLGSFSIQIDQSALETRVTFTPELGFPSAGTDAVNKRKIVVDFAPSISDLGGNPLATPDDIVFTPEFVAFSEVSLAESFDTPFNQDDAASGANWGDQFDGFLLPGISGGSGRLGDLVLNAGQALILNTDNEDFSGVSDPGIFNPASVLDATFDGTNFTFPPVTDGIFEFSSLTLNSGSQLIFQGTQPARVFVRGEIINQGVMSVGGSDSLSHDDDDPFGQTGALGGPSGGQGGDGGRQPSWENFESVTGVVIPDPLVAAPTLAELDGQPGGGAVDNILMPTGTFGGGLGGVRWPSPTTANPGFHIPVDPFDLDGVVFDIILVCQTKMKGGTGGGGAYGLNGASGTNNPAGGGGLPAPEPPQSIGGSASDFSLGIGSDPESPQRSLNPEEGWLHGGAGGGGGGAHLRETMTNGQIFSNCGVTPLGGAAEIISYRQHSGPAGGGGGGALQLQVGSRAVIDGKIDATGGFGGGKTTIGQASAGGGGAGGSILLQGPTVTVAGLPGRLDVSGGEGGFGDGASIGGMGGSGLIRYETVDPPTLENEISKLAPSEADLATLGATPADVFHVTDFPVQIEGPGAVSGAQSCWMRPEGNFFILDFLSDDGADLGWDATIIPNPTSVGPQSYRGDNALFAQSYETLFGNDLGVSPFVFRFQGARAAKQIDDLCSVVLFGEDSPIVDGSLTGWVTHPDELNSYFGDPALRPNMIRFKILFDRSNPLFSGVTGIADISLRVLPD